jgi:hypothetical protein
VRPPIRPISEELIERFEQETGLAVIDIPAKAHLRILED